MKALVRIALYGATVLLAGCCGLGVNGPVIPSQQPVRVTAVDNPSGWHVIVCARETESKAIEIAVGASDQDYGVLSWSQGSSPELVVPQKSQALDVLWVRVRVPDRKVAQICVPFDGASHGFASTDREKQISAAKATPVRCPCS